MNKTAYKMYIEEITKHPLLSVEEEISLAKEVMQGNKDAEQTLVNSNLRYVVSIAHKYSDNEDSLMDCIQEGNLGLMVAVSKFDYSFNTRICTYATPWITQYILRHKNAIEPIIHIPALKLEKLKSLRRAYTILEQRFGKEPTRAELSIYTGMSERELFELQGYDFTMVSIDTKFDSETESTLLDFIADDRTSPEVEFFIESEREEYKSLISLLPDREKAVMTHRYDSMIDGSKTSYRKMGSSLGVSIEATRQIEKRAKRRLQNIVETHFAHVYNEKVPV